MDATKRPLSIPQKFPNYAEKKEIFNIFQFMIQELLVTRPNDPLQFLIDLIEDKHNEQAPRAVIYGPPASGQCSLSKTVARKERAVLISPKELMINSDQANLDRSLPILLEQEDGQKLAKLILDRIQKPDCKTKGFILEGYPRTREQALQLQAAGVTISHWIHLKAQTSMLLNRYNGKRVDPITGDVYHIVFKPPTDATVASRLIEEAGGVEHNMHKRLQYYNLHSTGIEACYRNVCNQSFDADQPDTDLAEQVHIFLQKKLQSKQPYTPRVVLLGPTGVGKSWQATQISSKYNLVDVDISIIIAQELRNESQLGQQMRPFIEQDLPVPDQMFMKVVNDRLSRSDCITQGWILHGFPTTREHAELLDEAGFSPNRVFVLTAPVDVLKERLTWRRVDPITGERYHLLYNPPSTQEIKERLATHPNDKEDRIDARLEAYNSTIDDINDHYGSMTITISGEGDPYAAMETLESYIIHPLPKTPKQQ